MQHFKRLFSYAKRNIFLYILGTTFTVITITLEGIKPYFTKLIVDDGLMKRDFDKLGLWLWAFLAVAVLRSLFWYLRSCTFHYTSQKMLHMFRSELYDKFQAQSFSFYDNERTGLLMNRIIGDLESIRQFIGIGYGQSVEAIILFVNIFIIMFSMNIKLTVAVIAIMPIMYLNMNKLARVIGLVYEEIREAFADLTIRVEENATGIRVVKAFGRENFEKKKFRNVAQKFTDLSIESSDIQAKYAPLAEFINGLGLVLVLLIGGYLVIKGEITVGTLVAFNGYISMLRSPVKSISGLITQWQNATVSLEKIFELLEEQPEIEDKPDAVALEDIQGDITFRNVYFKYKNDFVLRNISFRMKPGSVTAIMGAAGSGKSTITNLIARFYDCTRGQVLVDGWDVKDLQMNSFRNRIGIIFQETFLFTDTIANNIAFGKPGATREEIERAARMADAHEFIMNMPYKYDTVVGERGVGLSGGQRQRIAIARAIICDPKVLILDDATSSVDMETEREIQQTLKEIMVERTTLIIAHRISSVKDADQIIYLEDGCIVESGTHEELLLSRGRYYNIFNEQYSEYEMFDQKKKNIAVPSGGVGRYA